MKTNNKESFITMIAIGFICLFLWFYVVPQDFRQKWVTHNTGIVERLDSLEKRVSELENDVDRILK